MKTKMHIKIAIMILVVIASNISSISAQIRDPSSVPFQVVPGSTFRVRGELKMIGNGIIGPTRDRFGNTLVANDPVFSDEENGSGYRAYDYVDIDGDPSTFSSSSSFLELPTGCERILYAGLYWSATYYDVGQIRSDLQPIYFGNTQPDPRPPFNTIKFRTPNSGYVTIPQSDVRILYDGYPGSINNPNGSPNDTRGPSAINPAWPNIENAVVDMPYHCYADVTALVQADANPEGDYFVADQRASIGDINSRNDLVAGWTLVVIYEDPSLPNKFISSNNGVAAISASTGDIDYTYSGFTTLPAPLPVNARFGIGSYEGDKNLRGDDLLMERRTSGIFERLTTTGTVRPPSDDIPNQASNFFDSSISVDGNYVTTKNPGYSDNQLGYDIDIFDIPNSSNRFIGNNQNAVNFRLTTRSDKFQVYVNTFEVEIIEPEMRVTKRVFDGGGTVDITGGDVNLGDSILYRLGIQNIGNEDIENATIRDELPINVNFTGVTFASPGITTNVITDPVTGRQTLEITIDDSVVERFDPEIRIDFGVDIIATCGDLRDACSEFVENVAVSTYTGVISDSTVSGEDSILETDSCRFDVVGTANALIRDDICESDAESAVLCRGEADLEMGTGFTSYEWRDSTGAIVSRDRTFTATAAGIYTVIGRSPDCRDLERTFEVLDGASIPNPIIAIANGLTSNPNANGNIRNCPVTGEDLPEIFLCGASTSLPLDSGFDPASTTIIWERLDPTACPAVTRNPDCPTTDSACEPLWTEVGRGAGFILNPSPDPSAPDPNITGEYRIRVDITGDCEEIYHFNVFQNNVIATVNKIRDIVCGTPGRLQVTGTDISTYEFQVELPDGTTFPTDGSFTNASTTFDAPIPGSYTINARLIGSPAGACTFPLNSVVVDEFTPTITLTPTQPACAEGTNRFGSLRVEIADGQPDYRYIITGPTGFTPRTISGTTDATVDFIDLEPGTYTVEAFADDDDGSTNCFLTDMETINVGTPLDIDVTPTATLQCNPDFQPNPLPTGTEGPFDPDEYIAIVQVSITSTPASGSYEFSTDPTFATLISPVGSGGPNIFNFRFTTTGNFTIYVRDTGSGGSCEASGNTTINPEVRIAATATAVDPECSTELGSIEVDITSGTAPFTFDIDGTAATPATSPTSADGLGIYTFANIDPTTTPVVTISDSISCDEELAPLSFTIPDAIDIDFGTITPLSCSATPTASIVIDDITGGSGNYQYSLDSPTGPFTDAPATPFTITGISGEGTHVLYVRNRLAPTAPPSTPDCMVNESFDIAPLLEVDDVTVTPTSVNCTAQTTEVTLSASPTATYEFNVLPDPATGTGSTGFSSTNTYTFENGVTYTVRARRTDSQCRGRTTFTAPNVPVAEIVNQRQTNPVTCNGGNDGAFEFSVNNSSTADPVTSFDYVITGPGSTNITGTGTTAPVVITGSVTTPIIAGTYTIEITDTSASLGAGSTGCTDTETVVITQPDPITFAIDNIDQDCATNLNEVTIRDVIGGNGPGYTYQISHPTTGDFPAAPVDIATPIGSIPNVPAGDPVPNYTITVFDVTGTCRGTLPLTITPLTAFDAAIADTSDFCLDDGTVSFIINVDATNTGAPPYTYTVSRGGTLVQTATTTPTSPITTNTFTQEGVYEITLTDDEGCEVILTETIAPVLTLRARRVNDLTCDPTSGASNDGRFELTIAGGTANYDITFENTTTTTTGNVALGITSTATPITFDSPDAGNYIFTVRDRSGSTGTRCVATATGELTDRTTPTITADDVRLGCEGDSGTVTITVTGPEAEYFVLFDDNDASTVDTFVQTVSNQIQVPNLPAGTYNFVVRDSRGCRFSDSVDVISPGPIAEASRNVIPITCDNSVVPSITQPGSITLTIQDRGALAYNYTLVNDEDVSATPLIPSTDTTSPNPALAVTSNTIMFDGVPAGVYYIFVEDDVNKCIERIGPFTVASDPSDLTILATAISTCPALVTLNVQVVDGVGPFGIEVFDPAGGSLHSTPVPPGLNGLPVSSGTPQERNHSIPGLPFNTRYEVRISDDASNCVYVQFVDPVDPPSEPVLLNQSTTPVSCNDTPLPTDGTFSFEIDVSSLGTSPAVTQVSWAVFELGSGAPATGTNTTGVAAVGATDIPVNVTDLPAGLYYVIVQEDDGTLCPVREDFEIEIPDPVNSNASDPTIASCDTEVSFSITTNGGTPTGGSITPDEGYRYSRVRRGDPVGAFTFDATTINDAFTVDPSVPADLQWDIYTRDDNGCIVGPLEIDINVTPGPSIDVNPGFVSNPCDLSDFTMQIEASATALNSAGNIFYGFDDGVNPVVLDEAPPGAPYTFTFPSPGTYDIIVQDNNGCRDTATITIFPRIEITAEFTTPPDCTTAPPLGVVTTTVVSPGSGVVNHTYTLIDNITSAPAVGVTESPAGSGTFINVPAGSYRVRVEDSGMGAPAVICPFETPVSIEAPDTPVIDGSTGVTNVNCNATTPSTTGGTGTDNGSITVSLTSPLDPNATYEYEIIAPPTSLRPRQSSPTFNNLGVDTYTVRVWATVENGPGAADDVVCFDDEDFTIGEPAAVTASASASAYSCDPADSSEQFPVITVEIGGGTIAPGGNYTISYTRPAPLAPVVDEVVVDADPAPGIQHQTIASEPGLYSFTIRDSNNCETTTGTTVPVFDRMNNEMVTVTAPGITCVTGEEVTITVDGGIGPFDFTETTGTSLSQIGVADATIGAMFTLPNPADETRTYRFRITDTSTDCFVEVEHTVDRVDFLEVTGVQARPETCFEGADGQISITVSGYTFDDGTTVTIGGTLNYTIIDPVTSVEVVDGLGGPIAGSSGTLTMTTDPQTFTLPFGATQGNYIIRVAQVGNPMCTEDSDPIVITGPVELELILPPFVTTTCALNDGEFTATTNGAQGDVTYQIVETGATSTDGRFTGLAPVDATTPRTYTVIATDTFTDPLNPTATLTCTDTETIEVRPPIDDLTIVSAIPTAVTCASDPAGITNNNGRIVVTATGTNTPLQYTITPVVSTGPLVLGTESDRQNSPTFDNLSPGDYVINVYDRAGCSRETSPPITITAPNPVTISIDNVTMTSCVVRTSDVTLSATSDAGGPFTFEARDITLRDVISTPTMPIADADRDRFVGTNNTGSFPGLPEGIYQFFVTDSDGCMSERSAPVVVSPPDPLDLTLDTSNTMIVCFGEMTGSVNASTTGGLGSNVYSLTPITAIGGTPTGPATTQNTTLFEGLGAGFYRYQVTSAPDCSDFEDFEITQPMAVFEADPTASDITCNGETDGTIRVEARGGNTNRPYTYVLFDSMGEIVDTASDEENGTTGLHVFEGLPAGTYTLISEDGRGCADIDVDIIINEPPAIVVTIEDITPEVCAGDSDGTVTLSITGGTPDPVTSLPVYFWSRDGVNYESVTDPTNLFIDNLPSGVTTIFIRDFNNSPNCENAREVDIVPGVNLNAELEAVINCPEYDYSDPLNPALIQEESYTVNFNIGEESEGLSIIYTLEGREGTPNPAVNSNLTGTFDVEPGVYEGFMEANSGADVCRRSVGTIRVTEYTPLSIPVAQMTGNSQDPNEYQIIVSGGLQFDREPNYAFYFTILREGITIDQLQESDYTELESNIFTIRETADYVLRVVDANGCEVISVQNLTYINIRIPNYFTPDSPNTSTEERFWYPRQITPNVDDPFFFDDMEVKVFDRYGRLLADFKGDQQGWDGLYQGKQLPSGDYWYTIILNDIDNREFTGHFTLYR